MICVTAGETITVTRDVGATGSETFQAFARDQRNKTMDASVTASAPNITVTVDGSEWQSDAAGYGRIEVMNTATKAVVLSEEFRVFRGLSTSNQVRDYGA